MFNVYSMNLEDFYDFGNLCSTTSSPLINRKKCESGEPFKLSEVVWIQIRKESPGETFFLTNFKDNFKTLDLRRNTRRILKLPQSLKILREERKPISRAKYQNSMTLLKWIPEEYKDYFKNLPYSDGGEEFPGEH
jgi:hypothetical protein